VSSLLNNDLKRFLRFWSEERSLTALLILLLLEMFVILPVTRGNHVLALIGLPLFALMLLAGLLTMARNRILQTVSGIFVVSALSLRVYRVVSGVPGILHWDALLSALSIAGMVVVALWQVYRAGPVTGHRIRGAIAAYLLIGITFAYAYMLIASLIPESFHLPAWASQPASDRAETFLYFSLTTLTTAGYGDITAVHPFARSLATLEALIGQLYPAILIARLVSLQIQNPPSKKKKGEEPS
jgi:Ion channel